MLTLAHIQSLSGAKLRSGNAPAHPCSGIRFADGLSAGGYEGVGLAEGEARAAKRPQGHAREPKRSEFLLLRGMLFR